MLTEEELHRVSKLAGSMRESGLKELFREMCSKVSLLHADMKLDISSVEVRAYLWNSPVCRLVPYPELLHVQVGREPVWDLRLKDRKTYFRAIDRVLEEYLQIVAFNCSSSD